MILKMLNGKVLILKNYLVNQQRGKRLKSADRIDGNLPFVTAGETNEGISAFIGNDVDIFIKYNNNRYVWFSKI